MRRAAILVPARVLVFLVAVTAQATPGAAQGLRVHATDQATSAPLQGVLVTFFGAAGTPVGRDLTDPRGLAHLLDIAPGSYEVRAELIGFGTVTEPAVVTAGETTLVSFALETAAIELEGLNIEAESRCDIRPEAGLTVARLWDEIRKALEGARLTQDRNAYQFRTRRYTRTIEEETGKVLDQNARFGSAYQTTPFESRPIEDLLANGFVQDADGQPGNETYYAPDAAVLLSDPFLDSHCMRLALGEGDEAGLIGVEFEPVENRRIPDIQGTLWVDPETWLLDHLAFAYVHTRPDVATHGIGGEVVFQLLPDGTWIVPEWQIRMPLLARGRDTMGRESIYQLGFHDVGATVVSVREPGGEVLFSATTAALDGVVVERGSGDPVQGVVVTLPGFEQRVVTDSDGSFRFTEVPEGDYVVVVSSGAGGAQIASAGVELEGGEVASITLSTEDPMEGARAACRAEQGAAGPGHAVVTGRVLAASDGRSVAGARVTIEWDDLSRFRERGIPDRATLVAITGPDGRYLACGVPTEVPLEFQVEWNDVRSAPSMLRLDFVQSATHDLTIGGER